MSTLSHRGPNKTHPKSFRLHCTDAFAEVLTTTKPKILLGSGSKSRRQLMDELASEFGFSYEVLTADIDEKAIRNPDPEALVLSLAHAKADAILAKMGVHAESEDERKHGFLITCDQVVTHRGLILEKPESPEEALRFIDGYGHAPAQTVGSTVCTDLTSLARFSAVDIATITFAPIPKSVAQSLVDEGEVMWCAGGLMVEHPAVAPYITGMEGGQDTVMGLSKARVMELICQAMESRCASNIAY